jgi:predicted ribosome quality control (RQC) complex YloA/Tae2 family protein
VKAWTVPELDNIVASLKPLVGARLQEVQTSESDLVLGFYTPQGVLWLWADLNAIRPCLLPWTELPLHVPARKNPLNLFLRAHFSSQVLRAVERPEHQGRVVLFKFGKDEDHLELEIRLFPHGRNVLARAGDKQIAWQKPKELSESVQLVDNSAVPRSLEKLREQWITLRGGKGRAKTSKDMKGRLEDELEKKKKALGKVTEELGRKRDMPWKQVGDWLKAHQSLNVPKEWEPFVDKRRKLSWNIEECFLRGREVEGKMYGTEKRIELLKGEISRLEQRMTQPMSTTTLERKAPQPLTDAGATGRTLRISDELTLIAGKSAADNLKLLRKARAWDYWFHLRDVPSSHAILFRNKNTVVGDKIVLAVVEWYVRQHFGQKYKQHAGEKIQILMAECRFVRPIKGDKIGRVTFQNERVVTFHVPPA